MKDIVLLDLFSGIGGFSKGLSDAGFNIVKHYFSEIDKHAIAVYKHQFKNSEYVGSVTALDGRAITRPNIITFGSPCQDFSVAGKRAGMGGERSSLIGEAIRLIAECRPDFFIWENVKGVFSSNNGEDFWAVIQAFTNIGGYRLEWQLLNTAWFLPQNRERIYLVGHLAKSGRDFRGVFPIREGDAGIADEQRKRINIVGQTNGGQHGMVYSDGLMSCLTSTDYKQPKQIIVGQVSNEGSQAGTVYSDKGLSPCISAGTHGYAMGNIQVGTLRTHNDGKGFREVESGLATTIPARAREREDGSGQPIIVASRGRGDGQQLEKQSENKTNAITGVQKDNLVVHSGTKDGFEIAEEGDSINLQQLKSKTRRGRVGKGVAATLDTQSAQAVIQSPARWSRTEKGKEERRKSKKGGKDYTPFSNGARELNPTDDENIGCITGATNKDSLVFVGGLGPHNRGDGSKSRDYSLQERVYDADYSLEAATISATMQSKYLNNSQIRRLTEIECERLQGFSDDWTKYGDYDGVIKEVAKTQRYKCLGNAVTVAVVREIGKRLLNK